MKKLTEIVLTHKTKPKCPCAVNRIYQTGSREGVNNTHFNWNMIFGIIVHVCQKVSFFLSFIIIWLYCDWPDLLKLSLDNHFKLELVISMQIYTNVHEFACFLLMFALYSANNKTVAKVQTAVLPCWWDTLVTIVVNRSIFLKRNLHCTMKCVQYKLFSPVHSFKILPLMFWMILIACGFCVLLSF